MEYNQENIFNKSTKMDLQDYQNIKGLAFYIVPIKKEYMKIYSWTM